MQIYVDRGLDEDLARKVRQVLAPRVRRWARCGLVSHPRHPRLGQARAGCYCLPMGLPRLRYEAVICAACLATVVSA